MSKGTVMYFGNFEMPDKDASAHRVINNAKILSDLGYKVVFCGVYRNDDFKKVIETGNYEFDSLPRKYPENAFEWCKDMLSFYHYKKCLDKYSNIKYIIVYDFHAIPFIKINRYCRRNGIKLVSDVTEWYENNFSFKPLKLIKWLDTALMMKHLLKKTDSMIAVSDYLEKHYQKYIKNIINIPPLVDISEAYWKLERNTSNSNTVNFVYAGTTDKAKDKLNIILTAFDKLKNKEGFFFSIYGITKSEFLVMYPDYGKLLDRLEKSTAFYGKVSHTEAIQALFDSDCSLIIRNNTRKNNAGFPTKYVECITSGIDVICSDISNIRRFSNEETILLCAENMTHEILSVTLEKYINSFERKANKKISEQFDYTSWKHEFAKIFCE